MTELSYRLAVRDALAEEMERDPDVVLLGEDVRIGGVFNATPELLERFGPNRVIDTPISELAFAGAAFGAALRGLRPVVEIMFADFLGLVLDTVANQASKYWYLSNEQASVPYTIRTTVGAGGRFGAIHSQTPTGWFMNLPGMKIVAPSNAADARLLLKAAIRDDNPVLVLEHKLLYGTTAEVAAGNDFIEPIGRAAVVRPGRDITIAAALAMVGTALAAAAELAADGIEAEVIDLRSLRPLDIDAIAESAGRTGVLVAVEEGPPTGGYASEVISAVAERDRSVRVARVTMPDLPIPFSGVLEDAVVPQPRNVVAAVRKLLEDRVDAGWTVG